MCDSEPPRAGSCALPVNFDRRPGQIVGDKNSRGRAGFDVALDDQGVVGADDRVAGNRKLFGQPPRRWQSRARPNPRVADGVAKLLDKLAGQWFAPGTIEEHGYLHERKNRLAAHV